MRQPAMRIRHGYHLGLLLAFGLLMLGMAMPGHAAGAVYKWTDAQGRVHYDDQNTLRGERMTREYVDKRQVKPVADWVGRVPADFARNVAQRCSLAREREASFGGAGQVYVREGRGPSRPLSSAQARAIRSDAHRDVARLCASDAPIRLYKEQSESAVAPEGRSYR